jgi:hypothetical protein
MVLVYMLTSMGDIDGIHGAPYISYIAAPWILWVMDCMTALEPSNSLVETFSQLFDLRIAQYYAYSSCGGN